MWVTRHVTRCVIVSGIPLVNLIHGHPFQVVAFLLRSGTLQLQTFRLEPIVSYSPLADPWQAPVASLPQWGFDDSFIS
jgi:hypothetical protein